RLIAADVTVRFSTGGIEGVVSSTEAQERQAQVFYQQTILNALRETNDALTGSQKKMDQAQLQRKRVEALREFARLSRLRFDKGVSGYLEVLVAENESPILADEMAFLPEALICLSSCITALRICTERGIGCRVCEFAREYRVARIGEAGEFAHPAPKPGIAEVKAKEATIFSRANDCANHTVGLCD
ncbi:MAG: TolC family protein, partial [Haliea sp.]|nr:TolC family protein [Haliea sp.]